MTETLIQIRNGSIVNPKPLKKAFELKDGKYVVRITNVNKRSLNQNAYYWTILTDYVQPGLYDSGYREVKTKEDAHEFCRSQFLKRQIVNELTGEMKEVIKSTADLTTLEFNAYIDEICQMAAEYLSVVIPEPNQQMQFL